MKHVYFTCLMCLIISTTTTAQRTSELFQTELRFLDGSVPQSGSIYALDRFFIQDDFNFVQGINGQLSAGDDLQFSIFSRDGLTIGQFAQTPALSVTYGLEDLVFRFSTDSFDNWSIGTADEGTDRKSLNIREAFGSDAISDEIALHIEPWTTFDGIQIGIGTEDPSETLDVDGAIKVREITLDPEPNVIYGNSTPLAYGRLNGNALAEPSFGVTSITKTAPGRYTIVIDNGGTINSNIFFTASMFDANQLGFISHFPPNGNTISVRTTDQFGTDTDRSFDFVVFGTPAVDD